MIVVVVVVLFSNFLMQKIFGKVNRISLTYR